MKKYYLAYGSNLNYFEMKERCPESRIISRGTLYDYRLVYKGVEDGYAYLSVEEALGYQVPIGIYEVSSQDIDNLDFYEGYPDLCEKCYLPIRIKCFKRKALIYIMKDEFFYHLPSSDYVSVCEFGYGDFGFDKAILDEALGYSISKIPKQKMKVKEM